MQDVWEKLGVVISSLQKIDSKLDKEVEEIKGVLFELRQENDTLKKELAECKSEAEKMRTIAEEAKAVAAAAKKDSEELEQYGRRNNVRMFGVPESDDETVEACEAKALKIIHEKLGLTKIGPRDIDAIHRLGARKRRQQRRHPQGARDDGGSDSDSDAEKRPRPIIIRFVSRKCTQSVLTNRRKLKNSGVVIVEDLTQARYSLFMRCREHDKVDDAWTKNGKVFVRGSTDRRVHLIQSLSDLMKLSASSTPAHPGFGRRDRHRRALLRNTLDEIAMEEDAMPKSVRL
nr:hypothetical protein BaRGS_006213 [Batillaria attramentaria]